MTGASHAGDSAVRSCKRSSFSLCAQASVFQEGVNECIGRAYTGEHTCICSDSQAALWALKASEVISRFV
jgi:hypothetical protein